MPAPSRARAGDEDALAYLRDSVDFLNLLLVELPNGDFAETMVRQFLYSAWLMELYGALTTSADPQLAAIAEKSAKEVAYHRRHTATWVIRLGDGTEESRRRTQAALDALWMFTGELFAMDEVDHAVVQAGIGAAGRFMPGLDRAAARTWAAFAAGSGITPILSIIKALLAGEPKSRVVLVYGNRDPASVMFRDQLDDLKDRDLARLSVHHVLSREREGGPLFCGRVGRARAGQLARLLCPPRAVHRDLVCGPATMNDEVRAGLLAQGAAPEQILSERFVAVPVPRPRPGPAAARHASRGSITVIADGRRRSLAMPQDGEALLEAALRQGVELPFACRAEVCGARRARVVEGEAVMASNHALDPQEVSAGFVLACQARPRSPRLVLDFDRAGPPGSPPGWRRQAVAGCAACGTANGSGRARSRCR